MSAEHLKDAPAEERRHLFLRDVLPEIKLALGARIDRHNDRSIPERYSRALPETVLVVTLRPDLVQAIRPIADELERDLTQSCERHGSLYDRSYRVSIREASADDAPLYRVDLESPSAAAERPEPAPAVPAAAAAAAEREDQDQGDETRIEAAPAPDGWMPGRFHLEVSPDEGEATVVPIEDPVVTVGRATDDPAYETTVPLPDMPHVSRRQLALLWSPEEGEPGFEVVNLGLNPLHVEGEEIPGARGGGGPLRLESVADEHRRRVAAGTTIRIGTSGPDLRVVDRGEAPADPDATVFE